jgi:hypothetical protein
MIDDLQHPRSLLGLWRNQTSNNGRQNRVLNDSNPSTTLGSCMHTQLTGRICSHLARGIPYSFSQYVSLTHSLLTMLSDTKRWHCVGSHSSEGRSKQDVQELRRCSQYGQHTSVKKEIIYITLGHAASQRQMGTLPFGTRARRQRRELAPPQRCAAQWLLSGYRLGQPDA